jgi:hypothetical protein
MKLELTLMKFLFVYSSMIYHQMLLRLFFQQSSIHVYGLSSIQSKLMVELNSFTSRLKIRMKAVIMF